MFDMKFINSLKDNFALLIISAFVGTIVSFVAQLFHY